MKDKILVFIIGLLVGAVVTALGFLIYEKVNTTNNMSNGNQMPMMGNFSGGMPDRKPDGFNNSNGNNNGMFTPPSNNSFPNNNSSSQSL